MTGLLPNDGYTGGEHYRISDLSVNKLGAVVCITDETMGDAWNLEEAMIRYQKKMAILNRKRAIVENGRASGHYLPPQLP